MNDSRKLGTGAVVIAFLRSKKIVVASVVHKKNPSSTDHSREQIYRQYIRSLFPNFMLQYLGPNKLYVTMIHVIPK